MRTKPYISADIGGSHITSVAINPDTKHIIEGTHANRQVDNKGTVESIIATWSTCLKETITKAGGISGIGFAMPGPFDYYSGISKIKGVNKYESLYGINIRQAIQKALSLDDSFPIRFVNDATAFAMGEAWGGIAAQHKKIMAITLGTGFGSAFLNNGLPVIDGSTVPKLGCVYHIPYQDGIADDYFSTRWFVDTFNKLSKTPVEGVKEIAQLANAGHIDAINLFDRFGKNLAEFLLEWIKKFNVEGLIIGGNISNAGSLFIPQMEEVFRTNKLKTQINVSELKEDAALLGAAHLVDDTYYQHIAPLLKLM